MTIALSCFYHGRFNTTITFSTQTQIHTPTHIHTFHTPTHFTHTYTHYMHVCIIRWVRVCTLLMHVNEPIDRQSYVVISIIYGFIIMTHRSLRNAQRSCVSISTFVSADPCIVLRYRASLRCRRVVTSEATYEGYQAIARNNLKIHIASLRTSVFLLHAFKTLTMIRISGLFHRVDLSELFENISCIFCI